MMMNKKYGVSWLLAVTAMFILPLVAAAADKTVYLPIIGNATGYKISDTGPAGGKVFFVSSDGLHGLEATSGRSISQDYKLWYNGAYITTNAKRGGVNAGQLNTERIINHQGAGDYAAQLCANYQGGGYGDWYLPSKEELNLLYLQKDVVGGFDDVHYWSSTEINNLDAWTQYFLNGFQSAYQKNVWRRVRCIRAF
ncbi:MAG: DUF1566 domain-containing protein [Pseudomonadota bacterium]